MHISTNLLLKYKPFDSWLEDPHFNPDTAYNHFIGKALGSPAGGLCLGGGGGMGVGLVWRQGGGAPVHGGNQHLRTQPTACPHCVGSCTACTAGPPAYTDGQLVGEAFLTVRTLVAHERGCWHWGAAQASGDGLRGTRIPCGECASRCATAAQVPLPPFIMYPLRKRVRCLTSRAGQQKHSTEHEAISAAIHGMA